MEQLQSANPTPNGFKKFKNNIVDLSDWLPTSGFDSEKLYPSDKEFTENPPRTTVHYTYWSKSAWTHDGKKFAQAQYNHGINSEKQGHPQWGSANAYLSRDGKTLYLITKHNAVASHAGAYNTKARGVETPAYYQKDITSSQYEGLVYTAAYWYLKDHPGRKEKMTYDEAERYLIGHGEITEEVGIGDHSDFTAPFADGLAQKFMNLINTVISEDN